MSFKLFTIKETYLVVNTDHIISVSVDLKTSSTVILCTEGIKYVVDGDIHKVIKELGIKEPDPNKKKLSASDMAGMF